jgi:O-antigen/teichoic acid export membrane protein
LSLGLAILLARFLGPEQYGIYAYVFALVSVFAIPAQFGLPQLVVRETAKAHVNAQWGIMRGVWRWATITTATLSAGVGLIILIAALFLAGYFSQLQFETFLWGLVLLPLIALGRLRGAALQGLRRVVLGQIPDGVLRPGLLIILTFAAVSWSGSECMSASKVMAFHSLAALMAFIFGSLSLHFSEPPAFGSDRSLMYDSKAWFSAIWPLALSGGMQQINMRADIIMLGFFGRATDVGVYRVAVQGASLVIVGLQVINTILPPYFARVHAERDWERLQQLAMQSARTALAAGLPAAVIIFLWSEEVIRLLFGVGYVGACVPLTILATGQVLNSAFCPVGPLLNMTGNERHNARTTATSVVVNIILNVTLIPLFGLIGAATASALTLAIRNYLLWRVAYVRLGIETMAIKLSRLSRSAGENV